MLSKQEALPSQEPVPPLAVLPKASTEKRGMQPAKQLEVL